MSIPLLKREHLVWGKSFDLPDPAGLAVLGHLQDHLMAVVAVVHAMLDMPRFARVARQLLRTPTSGTVDACAPLTFEERLPLVWAAAVHDLGKLSFLFQAKQAIAWLPLTNEVFQNTPPTVRLGPQLGKGGLCQMAQAWLKWDTNLVSRDEICCASFDAWIKNKKKRAALEKHGGSFSHGEAGDAVGHVFLGRLASLLPTGASSATETAWVWRHLARAAFAHHGTRMNDADLEPEAFTPSQENDSLWGPGGSELARVWVPRMETLATLAPFTDEERSPQWHGFASLPGPYTAPQGMAALAHWTAGLVTVADWLGSGLAEPGSEDNLVERMDTDKEDDRALFSFARIELQHQRWRDATNPDVNPVEAERARTVLSAQWAMLREGARTRAKSLFQSERHLFEQRHRVTPATGVFPRRSPQEPPQVANKAWEERLRPLQKEMLHLMSEDELAKAAPRIIIVEAPMGEGKTEAAEIFANRLIASGAATGAIFALPTEASTTRLRDRFGLYACDLLNLHAENHPGAHRLSQEDAALQASGQASWIRRQRTTFALDRDNAEKEGNLSLLAAQRFFTQHNRRSFLAPFTVCTVDQVELAVTPSRHSQVRALGLAGRVLIIDEAHAYDAYMRHILLAAVSMVARMGGWTIVLSATLPRHIRQQFLAAYSGQGDDGDKADDSRTVKDYPLITHLGRGEPLSAARTASFCKSAMVNRPDTEIVVEGRHTESERWTERFPRAWATLKETVSGEGAGCGVVVCNTIKRAQEVYGEIKNWAVRHNAEGKILQVRVELLHSRFRRQERQKKEEDLLAWAGKDDSPAERAGRILVATQVVEQSLDFDFDVMLTELAPVDLLIQRTGRLHRHERKHRPKSATKPRCFVLIDAPLHETESFTEEKAKRLAEKLLRNECAKRGLDSSLVQQVSPYLPNLSENMRDATVMRNTLTWLLQTMRRSSLEGLPLLILSDIRAAVDEVYLKPTDTDNKRHGQAYRQRITIAPKSEKPWQSSGVPEAAPHAETRLTEQDTIPLLILEKQGHTEEGETLWRVPLASSPSLKKSFPCFLADNGNGRALNQMLIDDLQGWTIPLPMSGEMLEEIRKYGCLNKTLVQELIGYAPGKDLPRSPLPFQVAQGTVDSGTRRMMLWISGLQMEYSTEFGLVKHIPSRP